MALPCPPPPPPLADAHAPINFKKMFFDKFLCPHILYDIAALNYIIVFYLSVSAQ